MFSELCSRIIVGEGGETAAKYALIAVLLAMAVYHG